MTPHLTVQEMPAPALDHLRDAEQGALNRVQHGEAHFSELPTIIAMIAQKPFNPKRAA